MFNNVFYNDKGLMHVFYVEDDPQWFDVLGMWASKERMVKGSNNWVRKLENEGTFAEIGAISVPEEWTNTFEGTDPGFASLEDRDFTLLPTSILAGNGTFDTVAEWEDWTAEWEVTRTWTRPPIEECTGRQKPFYSNTDNAFPNPLMIPEYLPVRRNALEKVERTEASGISIGAYPATEIITPSDQVLYVYTTPGAPVTTYEFENKRTGDNIEISYTVIPLTDSIDGSISYNQSAENMYGPRGYGKYFAYSDTRVISLKFNTDGTVTLTDYTGKKNNSRNLAVACNVKPIPDFTYSKDTPINVRFVINLSTQTYDAYIDGRQVADDYKIGGSIGNDGSFVEYLKDIGCIGVVAFEGSFKIINHSEKLLRVVDNELNLDEPNNPAVVDGVRTFYVGPTHKFKKLQDVANLLEPGDLVLVDGDVEYPDNVYLFKDGTPENPITIRGVTVNGRKPIIKNATGYRGIVVEGDYNIIDNFEVAANPKVTNGGIFHVAHGTVIRNCYVHDTYGDGILGSDDTGSLTIEFTEVARAGNTYDHAIYIGMNEILYPDGVLNVRFCYIHESMTATGIKSRAPRNNIYYNWVEDTKNRCLELSGPDMDFMAEKRAAAERGEEDPAYLLYDDELMREDSDIVGNVFIETDRNTNDIARIGGDGTGRTYGRFRFVNNTFINLKTTPNSNAIKVNFGIESVEMYNNVFYSPYAPMRIFYPSDDGDNGVGSPEGAWSCTWASGQRSVQGSNNWVSEGSLMVPEEWTNTIIGTDPGFVDAENFNFRLRAESPLRGAGTKNTVATWEDWGENWIDERKDNGKIIHLVCQDTQFPNPLLLPEYMAVDKADFIAKREIVPIRRDNTVMDIGAYSYRAEGQPVIMPLTLTVETSGTGVTVYSYSVTETEGIDEAYRYHGDYYVVIQVYYKNEPALTYAQKFNTENNADNCMFKLGNNTRAKLMVVNKFDETDNDVIVLAEAVEIQ